MKTKLLFLIFYLFVLIRSINIVSAQSVTAELDYTVGSDEIINFVEPDDIYKANITVHGYEEVSAVVVPFDIILAIDMSGTMRDNDEYNRRLDAAELFLRLCDGDSPTIAGPIRAGIIGFRRLARLEQGLTDNYNVFFGGSGVISVMRGQDLGVETNIADGMEKANQELKINGSNNTRAVILITDGDPTPDYSDQDDRIRNVILPDAIAKGFRYYTIALGDISYISLRDIAELTGGFFRNATAGALNSIFADIFEHVSKTMIASQITLHVQRDIGITRFVCGSLEVPPGIPEPRMTQLTTFEDQNQGWIDILMGQLGDGDNATLSFELQALECLPVDALEAMIEITPILYPNTIITYKWGTQTISYTLEEKHITCRKRPFFDIKKAFNPATNIIEITLINNFPHRPDISDDERTIKNIRVFEQLSPYFQLLYNGAPSPYYQASILLDPTFIPPRRFIPGINGNDFLYWEFSQLRPEESKKLSFRVEPLAWAPKDAGKILPVEAIDPKITQPPIPENTLPSKVYYNFSNQIYFKVIPDEWYLPSMLPDLSTIGGRPNLYIEPPLNLYEFRYLPPSLTDLSSDPRIPSSGPWPLTFNLFEQVESPDIWIDSKSNSFVMNWQSRENIDPYLDNDSYSPYQNRFNGVTGQGDLFNRNEGNRIYFRVHNSGSPTSQIQATVYILEQNLSANVATLTPSWKILGDAVAVSNPPWNYRLFYIEIPPNSIERRRYTKPFGIWEGVKFNIATVMIKVAQAPNEAHYSNNVSTETFLVVP